MKTSHPLNIIVVDDEFLVAATLKATLTELGHRVVGTYSSVTDANAALVGKPVDLVITDIFFHGNADGAHWGKELRALGIPYLLFSGASPADILRLVSHNDALGLIHKPVRKREVYMRLEALTLTGQLNQDVKSPTLTIRHKGRNLILDVAKITHVESAKNAYVIHTLERKYVETGNLWELKEKLPANAFYQVHRSYIVNLNFVRDYTARELRIDNGTTIPIGRKYRPDLIRVIGDFTT